MDHSDLPLSRLTRLEFILSFTLAVLLTGTLIYCMAVYPLRLPNAAVGMIFLGVTCWLVRMRERDIFDRALWRTAIVIAVALVAGLALQSTAVLHNPGETRAVVRAQANTGVLALFILFSSPALLACALQGRRNVSVASDRAALDVAASGGIATSGHRSRSPFTVFSITDRTSCERAIRNGSIAAFVSGALTAVFALIGLAYQPIDQAQASVLFNPWMLVDVVFILMLSLFVFRKSRIAATTLVVYFVATKTWQWVTLGEPTGWLVAVLFIAFYVTAMRGTYAWHATYRYQSLSV